MRLRLLALFLVAALSGGLAGSLGNAEAGAASPAVRLVEGTANAAPARACPLPAQFRPYFVEAAEDADLPMAMLVAVARVESNLRPEARSTAGAHGLLQVMPTTAAELDLDAFRTGENVLAGARYLRKMLDRFRSVDLALAAYNAGPTAVERVGGAPSAETLAYVRNVDEQWRRFAGCS